MTLDDIELLLDRIFRQFRRFYQMWEATSAKLYRIVAYVQPRLC